MSFTCNYCHEELYSGSNCIEHRYCCSKPVPVDECEHPEACRTVQTRRGQYCRVGCTACLAFFSPVCLLPNMADECDCMECG